MPSATIRDRVGEIRRRTSSSEPNAAITVERGMPE
jgi:hypothetical protein